MEIVSASQMRALDRRTIELGTAGHVLMERAGEGACAVLLRVFPHLEKNGARVVILAGKGNNGGDGFVMARLLREHGLEVQVYLLGTADQVAGDALRNLQAYEGARGVVTEIVTSDELGAMLPEMAEAGCVVDAMLGTGLKSEVRGLYADAIEMVNSCGAPVFAVDLPSGLDADTGRPHGTAIQAEATATFAFAKLGQVLYPGVVHCGVLEVVDIGIDQQALEELPPNGWLIEPADAARWLPRRGHEAHKGSAGHLLVVAGSRGKSGAAILATRAALRGGAGLVTLATPESVAAICAGAAYEAMTEPWPEERGRMRCDVDRLAAAIEGKAAVAAGPGLGAARSTRDLVLWLLRYGEVPLVLDADALNALARNPGPLRRARAPVILTPHPGEMARLAGVDTAAVQADRVGVASSFAAEHDCTVLLKGARTVIAGRGRVWVNPTGNAGMASGGMGDALTGLIGALLAQGLEATEAACLGAYLHGLAGDRAARDGMIGIVASDLIELLPGAMKQCDADAGA